MNQAIAKTEKNEIMSTAAIWRNTDKIREQFAPTLTPVEFDFFCSLGMGLNANPFIREIWAVKYDSKKPASIFLGRDFFRRKAQEQPDYNGHVVEAVYENDDCNFENGGVSHKWGASKRGDLLGAYCLVYRKNIDHPFLVYCDIKEYDKGFSNWKTMKATMIKKVAETQGFKMAYQGIFKGANSEAEKDIIECNVIAEEEKTTTQQTHPEPQRMRENPKDKVWLRLNDAKKAVGDELYNNAKTECNVTEIYSLSDARATLIAIETLANA